jgi:(p)ppGpp synthase/HD superfamily hydrolase
VAVHVDDKEAIAAAALHDTVEDTAVTLEEIAEKFGDRVAEYVWYLTKPPAFVGNRAKRKTHDRNRLKEAPEIVLLIKVMDVWHNYEGIREHDPKFYETWREEVRDLLYIMDSLIIVKQFAGDEFAYNKFLPWFGDL